jgi:hypothetical protein
MKDNEKLVNIFTYSTAVEASMARDLLENAGIPCMLANETFSSIYPIGHTSLGGIQLLVFESNEEDAIKLLENAQEPNTNDFSY